MLLLWSRGRDTGRICAARAVCLCRFFMLTIIIEVDMKNIIPYLRPYWKKLLLSALVIGVSTFCDLMLPTIMSDVLNQGVYRADYPYIVRCCAAMLAVAAVGLGGVLIGSKLSCEAVASFCGDLRAETFRRVNAMTFEEFGSLGTAALVTRCSHDVETVSWIAAELSGPVITIPAMFLGGMILAFRKDPSLCLTILLFVPWTLAVIFVLGKKLLPLNEAADEYIDRENELMRQRLRGIRVIRAFGAEKKEHEKVSHAIEAMSEKFIKANMIQETVTPLVVLLMNLAAVLVVYLGGWRMENGGGLTAGDIFAVVQYTALISGSLIMGVFAILSYPQAQVAAKRVSQVLLAGKGEAASGSSSGVDAGEITFSHVTFRYEDAAAPAVEDVSFRIRPGESVAVIGGTGSGKSTLLNLLLGFRAPTSGEIRLDGILSGDLSREVLRDSVSCAMQSGAVYSGTVRENVRMGRLDASDEEIWEALEISQAAEYVRAFSDELDHPIRQSGKNLSGGQKQRLSIARAVVKKAPIYVFDDSFSALDFLTESRVRTALNRALAGRTRILITQRVASAMHCGRVLVMDGGHLVDSGTHAELLDRCKVYRDIYLSQTGGGTVEEKK